MELNYTLCSLYHTDVSSRPLAHSESACLPVRPLPVGKEALVHWFRMKGNHDIHLVTPQTLPVCPRYPGTPEVPAPPWAVLVLCCRPVGTGPPCAASNIFYLNANSDFSLAAG